MQINYKKVFDVTIFSVALICLFTFFVVFTQIFSGNLEKIILSKMGYIKNIQANLSVGVENITKSDLLVKKNDVLPLETQIQSGIAVNVNKEKQQILFEKDENKILPIASITKLMTAIIVSENIKATQKITISKEAANQEKIRKIFKGGEIFTTENLLKSMLVESNNSAAFAFYEFLGKEKFISLMNNKAKEIGLKNTEFLNPTGIGLGNYSTAYDLAQLAEFLVKTNSPILQITQIKNFDLLGANNKFHHRVFNLNDFLKNPEFDGKIILGKTGETAEAKQCLLLVTKSPFKSSYIINVILGSKDRFGDMEKLINWENYAFLWN